MLDFLSFINIILFFCYIYSVKDKLGFIEAYSFNWIFFFLSFEFFPFYLEIDLVFDAKLAYLTFFTATSFFLLIFSWLNVKPFRNLSSYVITDEEMQSSDFLKVSFWVCLCVVLVTLLTRYLSGSLVLGVDYHDGQGGAISQLIGYVLMLLGFNHTGYWFYMGLLSLSFLIVKITGNYRYFIFSILFMALVSIVTTQKTYFLFTLISIVILLTRLYRNILKQVAVGVFFVFFGSILILLLNNLRYVKKGNSGSIFEYFDFDTLIWYMSLRLDYATSATAIINAKLIDGSEYILEVAKSFLFILPKSVLFDGNIYGIQIAQAISYSDNLKAGVSFIPFAHLFEMFGGAGVIFFSFIMATCYSYFSAMFSRDKENIFVIYYMFMIPLIYYTSLTAPLHENIYTLLRSSLSFVIFLFMCKVIFKVKSRL